MSTYTSSLGLEEITPGDQAGLWGNTTNNNLALIDQAVTGVTPINFTGLSGTVYTLTDFNGALDEARAAVLNVTGIATGTNTIVVPNKQKTYLVRNSTGRDIIFRTATPSATYTVSAGNSILIFCDGSNGVFTGIASPSVGTLGVTGGGTGATTFGAGGFIKSSGGTNALTSSAGVALGSEVTGTLPVANGGTGQSTLTSGALVVGAGTSPVTAIAPGANGTVLTSNGTAWTAAAPVTGVASFNGGTTGLTPATVTTGAITLAGTLNVTNGGTGATSASSARTNLGLGTVAVINTNGSTTTFLRGDGTFATPAASGVTSITAGTGISVTGTASVPIISLSNTLSPGNFTNASVSVNASGVITAVSSGSGSGVTSVTATSPLSSSGGTTPNITISSSPSFAGTVSAAGGLFSGTVRSTVEIGAGSSASTAIYMSTGGNGSAINWYSPSTGNAVTSIFFSASGNTLSQQAYVFSYSNVGASTVAYQFYGDGTANKTGGGSWGSISDARLKDNIQPLTGALSKITALNPVSYKWKFIAENEPEVGFISQEVKNVIPNAVKSQKSTEKEQQFTDGETLSIAWQSDMTAYLVGAIKELSAKVTALEEQVLNLSVK
jgi:hypothetical protein